MSPDGVEAGFVELCAQLGRSLSAADVTEALQAWLFSWGVTGVAVLRVRSGPSASGAEVRAVTGGVAWLADADAPEWCTLHSALQSDDLSAAPNLACLPLGGAGAPWGALVLSGEFGPLPATPSLWAGLRAVVTATLAALRGGARREAERSLRAHAAALETAARTDPLTALGNRRAFDADLEVALGGGAGHVLLLDLDELKPLNDTEGHARGDALLRAFAHALHGVFREDDRAYRLGGDEFVVLVQGEDAPPRALLERVRRAVEHTRAAGFAHMNVSAGVASFPTEARAPNDLVRLADQRMLREKAARRVKRRLRALNEGGAESGVEHGSGVLWSALRATLALLTRDGALNDEGWGTLLGAAVAAIPGAEGGALYLHEGDNFVLRAQVGFSDKLLGLLQPEAAALIWYGEVDQWQAGRARVIRGREVIERTYEAALLQSELRNKEAYEEHGEIARMRASLCAPVVLDGHVVAQLNLDNLRDEDAFGEGAAELAEEFAAQIAALLVADARREREDARRRELESLVRVSAALRAVEFPEEAEAILVRQVEELLGTPDVTFLRYDAARDVLCPTVTAGLYVGTESYPVVRERGLSWEALRTAAVLRSPDSEHDARVDRAPGFPHAAVMVAPLQSALGQDIGTLVVSRDRRAPFSDLDAQLLGAIASAGATAIERARGSAALSARAEELRTLAELSTFAGVTDEPLEVARRCLSACRAFLKADFAGYFPQGRRLEVSDGAAPQAFMTALWARQSGPGSVEMANLARTLRRVVATADYPREAFAAPDLVAAGVRAAVIAPVRERGEGAGLLSFTWFTPLPSLPPAASALATRAAELVGQALERRAYVAHVEATREGALLALGLALELRDFETAGHTRRVVAMAQALGHEVGLAPQDLEALRQGAYLHDIGKLAVPDPILLKGGRLDEHEWAIMRAHAQIGYDFTSHIPTLRPLARLVVRHHHERWDGRGYPDGLAGEAIPLAARVFSVVDVYDALTNERPYKRAWTPAEAVRELREQAGKQFDPEIVATFLRLTNPDGTLRADLLSSET